MKIEEYTTTADNVDNRTKSGGGAKKASPLPPLYARWFEDLLGGEIPHETRATCHVPGDVTL